MAGKRYAILYSGSGSRRALNDLEYCYRLLIKHYQFAKEDISVLYFHGRRQLDDGSRLGLWLDSTDYTIKVDKKANRQCLKDALSELTDLESDDLLFIYIGGHGDFDLDNGHAWFQGIDAERYFEHDFWTDTSSLPACKSLLIVLQPCYSAGFIDTFVQKRISLQAELVSVACSTDSVASHSETEMLSAFSRDWVGAHFGCDIAGGPLPRNPDTDGNGHIEAVNAFRYANALSVDGPQRKELPPRSERIRLD